MYKILNEFTILIVILTNGSYGCCAAHPITTHMLYMHVHAFSIDHSNTYKNFSLKLFCNKVEIKIVWVCSSNSGESAA